MEHEHEHELSNVSEKGMRRQHVPTKFELVLACFYLAVCSIAAIACLVCIYWFLLFGWFNTTAFMFIPLAICIWGIHDGIKDLKG